MRLVMILALSILVHTSCSDGGTEPAAGKPAGAGPGRPRIAFTEIGSQAGITLRNVSGAPDKMFIVENLGAGAALIDYDGDGDLDLYICNGDVLPSHDPVASPNALYRNDGNWRFTDVTKEAGADADGWCFGANATDFDSDGRTDLFITKFGRCQLLRNLGDGKFEDVTEKSGAGAEGFCTASCFFDADGDQDLDLYVGRYVEFDVKKPPNDGKPCDWKGLMVSCGPRGLVAASDIFYEQVDGRFVESTAKFGFDKVRPSYTLATVDIDHDGDGDTDLYVGNDSLPNYLFENRGGKFVDVALDCFCSVNQEGREQASMGIDVGDINDDGKPDIFITNFSHDTNTLYVNESTPGLPLFGDMTGRYYLAEPSFHFLSWGTRFFDADRDGDLDIFVASGHVYPQVNGAKELGTTYAQRNQLYVNSGNGRFEDIAGSATDGLKDEKVSRGAAFGDIDEDGDIDIVVTNVDDAPSAYRNDTEGAGNWIGFALTGKAQRESIGARIDVTLPGGKTRTFWRTCGTSYLSTCDPRIHVGLGTHQKVSQVTVTWPGGRKETVKDLAGGRYWRIVEGDGEAVLLRPTR